MEVPMGRYSCADVVTMVALNPGLAGASALPGREIRPVRQVLLWPGREPWPERTGGIAPVPC